MVVPTDSKGSGAVVPEFSSFNAFAMTVFQAVILGLVQGLAEFLPISSSAHLALTPWLLGWPDRSGTHERAPDGFLLAYGSNVAPGELPRGAIVDLAPTILYYLGLPVGRDMDGVARTDLFGRTFTMEHPVASIATYER